MRSHCILSLAVSLCTTLPAFAGKIADWKLDETSGTIFDSTGLNLAGTATGAPLYGQPGVPNGTYGSITVAGASGTAIHMGPTNEYFTIGSSNINNVMNIDRTGAFTVMGWINMTTLLPGDATFRMVSTGSNTGADGGWGFALKSTGGTATVRMTTYGVADNDSVSPGALAINTWYHIAATYNNGAIDYYFNGNLLGGSDVSLFNNDSANARLNLGSRLNGLDQSNAIFDGIRVYDSVLDASSIRTAAVESVVPEPASVALASLGLGLMLGCRRRRGVS